MVTKGNDPAELWHKMLGDMEKGFNAFANQAMATPEFSKAMNRAGGIAAGAQKQFGDLMEKYLVGMNMPSRAQIVSLGERLQAVEAQLHEIKALLQQIHHNSAATGDRPLVGTPRPPRTKRPPSAAKGDGA